MTEAEFRDLAKYCGMGHYYNQDLLPRVVVEAIECAHVLGSLTLHNGEAACLEGRSSSCNQGCLVTAGRTEIRQASYVVEGHLADPPVYKIWVCRGTSRDEVTKSLRKVQRKLTKERRVRAAETTSPV